MTSPAPAQRGRVLVFRHDHADLGVGPEVVGYEVATGNILVGDAEVDGKRFLEDMHVLLGHIEKQRVRDGHDPKPSKGVEFETAMPMTMEESERRNRDLSWVAMAKRYARVGVTDATERAAKARECFEEGMTW